MSFARPLISNFPVLDEEAIRRMPTCTPEEEEFRERMLDEARRSKFQRFLPFPKPDAEALRNMPTDSRHWDVSSSPGGIYGSGYSESCQSSTMYESCQSSFMYDPNLEIHQEIHQYKPTPYKPTPYKPTPTQQFDEGHREECQETGRSKTKKAKPKTESKWSMALRIIGIKRK